MTVGLDHEPGDELQVDWLELSETPWGEKAYVFVGALSHSGRICGVFADGMTFAHLIEALDGVLRRLGGTPRSWRTDRMATVVYPGTDRLRPEAAAAAKHCGVRIAVCPPLRPQRKGVVEKAIDYVTQSWWRSAPVSTPAEAQADLDRWTVAVSDRRRRGAAWSVSSRALSRCSRCLSCRSRLSIRLSGSLPTMRWSRLSQPLQRRAELRGADGDGPRAARGHAPGDLLDRRAADRPAPSRPERRQASGPLT